MKACNPPLPKPAIKGPTGTGTYFDGFTEAQLLAYRAEVIEMCAAKCEYISDKYTAEDDDQSRVVAQWCAEEIRSLK